MKHTLAWVEECVDYTEMCISTSLVSASIQERGRWEWRVDNSSGQY